MKAKEYLIALLKKAYEKVRSRTRIILIAVILLVLGTVYFQIFKTVFFVLLLTAIAGASKIYHRFFKNSAGIDLVLFSTIIVSLAYNNLFYSLFAGWVGLIVADTLGMRFSHTSIISLVGITAICLLAPMLSFLPVVVAAIALTLVFEVIAAMMYSVMGSGLDRLVIFLVTHILFNLFLILSFAERIIGIIR